MVNPYKCLPEQSFWKKAVYEKQAFIFPEMARKFVITSDCKLATAGSCFAQNVAKHLRQNPDVDFWAAEELRDSDPVFSGRYGNIYTAHQLLQLFDECESRTVDAGCAIQRHDGRYVDINRPYMYPEGFETAQEVLEARRAHIEAVRPVFHEADVFVFTLGLTEAWRSVKTGQVYPICPGVYANADDLEYEFTNYRFSEIETAMNTFLERLKQINPKVKVLLTVSPVPLTATYTEDHVLVATMNSKSVLRVVCSEMLAQHDNVFYFPSFEMISNPYTAESAYVPGNLREVRQDVIKDIMAFFDSEFLGKPAPIMTTSEAMKATDSPDDDIMCDDVEIEKSMGF